MDTQKIILDEDDIIKITNRDIVIQLVVKNKLHYIFSEDESPHRIIIDDSIGLKEAYSIDKQLRMTDPTLRKYYPTFTPNYLAEIELKDSKLPNFMSRAISISEEWKQI